MDQAIGNGRFAFIALGSNLGQREQMLLEALGRLHSAANVRVLQVSGIYETDPVGYTNQPAFLNMAALICTTLNPLDLLQLLLDTEQSLGRVRELRWGPRTIDLDLLYYEDAVMNMEQLTLPHPRMMERAFVLVPLRDCLSGYKRELPIREAVISAAEAAQRTGKEGITLWNTINWRNGFAPSVN